MSDLIDRQEAINAIYHHFPHMSMKLAATVLYEVPTAEPERGDEWTTEEVAELLFNIFGDDCACNFNDIDEWLPERCKYTEIAEECPSPKEKHGCWMQFLIQGGADMIGGQDDESRSNSNAQTDISGYAASV